MHRSAKKKTDSSGLHEGQLSDALARLRAWTRDGTELFAILTQGVVSTTIRCRVGELENGMFSFFQADLRVGFMATIPRFTRVVMGTVVMGTGDAAASLCLTTDSGESLMIFDIIGRPEDLLERFPAASSAVQ